MKQFVKLSSCAIIYFVQHPLTKVVDAQHNCNMTIKILPPKLYIDELREKANLSDQKIGESVGMSRTSIWRLRMGKHKTTELEHGVKIANLHAEIFRQKR